MRHFMTTAPGSLFDSESSFVGVENPKHRTARKSAQTLHSSGPFLANSRLAANQKKGRPQQSALSSYNLHSPLKDGSD
jgi:hypothetical protein